MKMAEVKSYRNTKKLARNVKTKVQQRFKRKNATKTSDSSSVSQRNAKTETRYVKNKRKTESTTSGIGAKGIEKGKFPSNPDELMPELPREVKGSKTYIHPNENTRIRIEQHELEPGETFNPRHHGLHYHVEVKTNPSKSWGWHNRKSLQDYIKPPGYTPNSGTGFIPGEYFPGWIK